MDDGPERADDDLVSRTLAGDRGAFAELYDRYARLVRAVAFGAARDPATVQDVTQECFLRAFRQLRSLRERARFRFWLVGIARQVVREHRRRRSPEALGEYVPSPEEVAVRSAEADEFAHVLRLVGRLPEPERLAVHFFFLGERDANETARLLNRSRSGTYDLLKRACARLARWLGVPEEQQEARP
jgi:RNA polymerase sigma-70 factor (ECF subfamily)